MNLGRKLLALGIAGSMALAAVMAAGGTALAYGHADGPLAQLEFSGNCNNPDFFLCQPPPSGFGTGGIWYWIEIDTGGTGDIAGAVCFHTVGGVGGPGGAGASSIRGEITWSYTSLAAGLAAGAEFFGMFDPGDLYYMVSLPGGEIVLFPTTTGHYSFQPTNGVTLQMQVAP